MREEAVLGYIRIRLKLPLMRDLYNIIGDSSCFDDVSERERLAEDFVLPLRRTGDPPIQLTPTMPLEDFVRIWRVMRSASEGGREAIVHSGPPTRPGHSQAASVSYLYFPQNFAYCSISEPTAMAWRGCCEQVSRVLDAAVFSRVGKKILAAAHCPHKRLQGVWVKTICTGAACAPPV
jgi:hypothetical protein